MEWFSYLLANIFPLVLQLSMRILALQDYDAQESFDQNNSTESNSSSFLNITWEYSESAWLEKFQAPENETFVEIYQSYSNDDLFEGDMIITGNLTDVEFRKRIGLQEGDDLSGDAALSGIESKWPNAEVPYAFAPDCSNTLKDTWQKAVGFFKAFTCVKLRPKNPNDKEHVYISQETRECGSSDVGRIVGFRNDLKIGYSCEGSLLTVIHEIMHSIGFIHEQSRPDRDEHVSIAFANVIPSQYKNFQAYRRLEIDTFNLPYDYHSVMHYTWDAFSISPGNKPTVIAKDPKVIVGQQKFLSLQDITQIKLNYKCPNTQSHYSAVCPKTKPFKCSFTVGCLERSKVCDGQNDCGDNSDELSCSNSKPSESARIWALLRETAAAIVNQKYPPEIGNPPKGAQSAVRNIYWDTVEEKRIDDAFGMLD